MQKKPFTFSLILLGIVIFCSTTGCETIGGWFKRDPKTVVEHDSEMKQELEEEAALVGKFREDEMGKTNSEKKKPKGSYFFSDQGRATDERLGGTR